eukprot:CAMPEP_0178739712 /NCGR_PEP_ID=MMETSP0744-20121128/4202_1 /TAXON_ID=913974 /ORGANISM="Nitzschia punctata, Strain CCMP561" /LENGTH=333 /DNA_ID=CAMNT_0020392435 /DNA_START=814 /DNA_END=1816 /DNA_ORIENTATION=-
MISKSSVLVLVLVASVATAFRAPENPTAVKIPIKKTVGTVVDIKPPEDVVISSDTLTQVGKSVAAEKFIKSRHAEDRKKWGVDNANDCEYWYDSRIHTLGNIGFLGAVHAALAPLSTKIIDDVAYEGLDVRAFVAEQLSNQVQSSKAKTLLWCRDQYESVKDAFPESEFVVGVDTSNEMITMANFLSSHLGFFKPIVELFKSIISIKKPLNFKRQRLCRPVFSQGNAEQTEFPGQSFDLVTIMYALKGSFRKHTVFYNQVALLPSWISALTTNHLKRCWLGSHTYLNTKRTSIASCEACEDSPRFGTRPSFRNTWGCGFSSVRRLNYDLGDTG